MSNRFIDRVITFLDTIYNLQGPTVKTPEVEKMIRDEQFKNVIPYLVVNKFIKVTWKNESNTDVSPENISHVHLTDSGMEFLTDYKNREAQKEFNKIVAFTAAVLALIGIYGFIKDLGLINQTNFWISYIFLGFVVIAIGPIVAFIIKSYFSKY
ncbi:MAG: hypothetical protein AABX53_01200 [Nanoarchaeota archaeon]